MSEEQLFEVQRWSPTAATWLSFFGARLSGEGRWLWSVLGTEERICPPHAVALASPNVSPGAATSPTQTSHHLTRPHLQPPHQTGPPQAYPNMTFSKSAISPTVQTCSQIVSTGPRNFFTLSKTLDADVDGRQKKPVLSPHKEEGTGRQYSFVSRYNRNSCFGPLIIDSYS